eukprot:437249-Prymnesium_polylepis.1
MYVSWPSSWQVLFVWNLANSGSNQHQSVCGSVLANASGLARCCRLRPYHRPDQGLTAHPAHTRH